MFSTKINAIFVVIWAVLRYLFVKIFWPFFKPSKTSQKVKFYYNGDIISSNDNAEAVVTKGHKIVFVGSYSKAKEFISNEESVEMIDLKGKTLSPGFIDPHLHPSMAAFILTMNFITPFDWSFPWSKSTTKGVRSEKEYRQKLMELCQKLKMNNPTEWIFTWGYHSLFHGNIDRPFLDEICPNQPLVVWHRSFHALHLNSKAIEECNLTKEDFENDSYVDFDGGHFFENGLQSLNLKSHQIMLNVISKLEKGYEKVTKIIQAGGITTIADMEYPMFDETLEDIMSTLKLSRSSQPFLTLAVPSSRMFGHKFKGEHSKAIEYIKKQASKSSEKQANFRMFSDHVKILVDGAFFSLNMQMNVPFLDGSEGKWMIQPDDMRIVMAYYWKADFQIHLHTNGDKAMDLVIENVINLQKVYPRVDHKTTIEHAGFFTEKQADQLAELGCLVSAQPYYYYALKEIYSDFGLGPEKARLISPIKWLTDRKIPLALHSDFTMAPAKPLFLMWTAVNKTTINGSKDENGIEGINVQDAFDAVTINAAKVLGVDKEMGSIIAGKLANFVILDQNPLKVDPMVLKDINIQKTVYNGCDFKLDY